MTSPHRRRWMREYMSNYRRNSKNGEELRKAHRFDSFVWRLSKSLSPRYDILMCSQYGPGSLSPVREHEGNVNIEYKSEDTTLENDESMTEVHPFEKRYAAFVGFYLYFDTGGEDIFKVFEYSRFYVKSNNVMAIFGMIGTVDKEVLLKHLEKLTQTERRPWEGIITKLISEKERGKWREIDLSFNVDANYHWHSVEWAPQDDPDWNSVKFQTFLRMWDVGYRKLEKREESE